MSMGDQLYKLEEQRSRAAASMLDREDLETLFLGLMDQMATLSNMLDPCNSIFPLVLSYRFSEDVGHKHYEALVKYMALKEQLKESN